MVEQDHQAVLDHDLDGILRPRLGRKAVRVHRPVGGQGRMPPYLPGSEFRLPVIGDPARTVGPPGQGCRVGNVARKQKVFPPLGGQGRDFLLEAAVVDDDGYFCRRDQALDVFLCLLGEWLGHEDQDVVEGPVVVGVVEEAKRLVQQNLLVQPVDLGRYDHARLALEGVWGVGGERQRMWFHLFSCAVLFPPERGRRWCGRQFRRQVGVTRAALPEGCTFIGVHMRPRPLE
mmetsp:Transcript_25641/g.71497  ORF Transcript_25641/g.71497 Transcript_25641/m.71497 type:complete len:231 (-) Transcript_25641:264-956(-)